MACMASPSPCPPSSNPAHSSGADKPGHPLLGIGTIGGPEAIGHGHTTIFQPAALRVTGRIERRNLRLHKALEMSGNLGRKRFVPIGQIACSGDMGEREENVLKRRGERRHASSPRRRAALPLMIPSRNSSLMAIFSKSLSQRSGVIIGQSEPNRTFFLRMELQ